jgi:hypothetical protein
MIYLRFPSQNSEESSRAHDEMNYSGSSNELMNYRKEKFISKRMARYSRHLISEVRSRQKPRDKFIVRPGTHNKVIGVFALLFYLLMHALAA